MVREIIHDPIFLSKKSEPATKPDMTIGRDLLDTLIANREICLGLAANMIGINKCIIAINNQGIAIVMYNPLITSKAGEYLAEEGCLSLSGTRKTIRYNDITVKYQDIHFRYTTRDFSGLSAQIIQHEIDHTNGILI